MTEKRALLIKFNAEVAPFINWKNNPTSKVYFLLNQSALSSARLQFTEENFSAQAKDSSLRNQSAAPSLIIVKLRSWPKFLRLLERHIYPRHFVLSGIKMRLTEAELSAQPKSISPPYYKTASHGEIEG